RIFEKNLLAAGSFEDVVAKLCSRRAQASDFGLDVLDDEVDAIPPAWSRFRAIRHWPPRRAGWAAKQQTQPAARDVSDRRRKARQDFESKHFRIESDRFLHVVDHISDADHLAAIVHDFLLRFWGADARSLITASRNAMRVASSAAVCS